MNKTTVILAQVGILLTLPSLFIEFPASLFFYLTQVVLLLIAHNQFASCFNNRKIFTPLLLANLIITVFTISGAIYFSWLFIKLVLPGVVDGTESMGFDTLAHTIQDLQEDIKDDPEMAKKIGELVIAAGGQFLLAFGMILSGFVAWAVLTRVSLNALGQSSSVSEFKTAGLLYLVGSITSIILVGFILLFVGYVFQVIGYFKLKAVS